MNYINQIKKMINDCNIKAVSFDIFDTFILRMVSAPDRVFIRVWDNVQQLLAGNEKIDSEQFRVIRMEAERLARKKKYQEWGNYEITLDDIYSCMPALISKKEIVKQMELESEKELCYVNFAVWELIQHIREKNIKIVLTSDMYLRKSQIEMLLKENGVDHTIFSDIYISCEKGVSKSNQGELYDYVLEQLKILPEELLHIGDNYMSDIVEAKRRGIHTFYYDVISSNKNLELTLEGEMYSQEVAEEVTALRKVVFSKTEYEDESQNQWYKLGSLVCAPFFASAAEWLLDIAEKEGVKQFVCLMRDGEFLSKLLEQAQNCRRHKVDIKLAFVSRRSLMLPAVVTVDEQSVTQILNRMSLQNTVSDILEDFCLEDDERKFVKYYDKTIAETKTIFEREGQTVYHSFVSYLLNDTNIKKIQKLVDNQKKKTVSYLKQLGVSEKTIYVDFDCKGTNLRYIDSIMKKEQHEHNIYTLILGDMKTVEAVFDDLDIRTFTGGYGKNRETIEKVTCATYILDLLVTSDKGTTIGYKMDCSGKIVPELNYIAYPNPKQLDNIKIFQQGVLDFQKEYLRLKEFKIGICAIQEKYEQLLYTLARLIKLPTVSEAKVIGELYYDENFADHKFYQICPPDLVDEIKKKQNNPETIIEENSGMCIKWINGVATLADPMYYVKKLILESGSGYIYNGRILKMIEKIKQDRVESVVIVGAGDLGKTILSFLNNYTDIQVEAFIDSNKNIWGCLVDGVPVHSTKHVVEAEAYVIASVAFSNELVCQLKQEKGEVMIYVV